MENSIRYKNKKIHLTTTNITNDKQLPSKKIENAILHISTDFL